MFAINHAATALVVKKKYPQAPILLLLISVQLMELFWVVFNYLGIEYSSTEDTVSSVLDVHLVHMPYSHSIVSTFIVAFIVWLAISKYFNKPKVAIAAAIAIVSHIVLDLLTHVPDIALSPFIHMEKYGLGLYSVPMLALLVETFYGIFCWWIFRGSSLLFLTIVGFNLANFTFLSTMIVGPEALLANQPLLLTTFVFIQIVVTLTLVGVLSRHKVNDETSVMNDNTQLSSID